MSTWLRRLAFFVPFAVAAGFMLWPTRPSDRTGDGRIIVTYWEKWTGFEGQAIRDAVDRFNDTVGREKGIYVQLFIQGDIEEKVKIAAAGGAPPDLAGLYSFNVAVYASQNALVPLDEMLAEAGIGERDFIPSYWRLCRHDGRTWCLPTAPATLALFWNKRLFREAGLDPDRPPRTLEELTAIGHRLTAADPDTGRIERMGFLPSEPGWWSYAWGWWFGGRLWDGEDAIAATEPENLEAFRWIEEQYVDRYGPKNLADFKGGLGKFASADNGFFTGKVAMELQGVWFPNFIDRYAPEGFEYGVAPIPPARGTGLENVTIAEADVIGIPRGARHVEEAFEFVKFLASVEGMEILCKGQGKHSSLAKTSPGFLDPETHPNPHVELFYTLAFSPNAKRTPALGLWREYQREMSVAFDNIWNGNEEPAAALKNVQTRMQRRLDQELRRRRLVGKE